MKEVKKGEFFGSHYQKIKFDDVIITDTEYIHAKVDWHYHENPYFTYLLEGKLFEENKKTSYFLAPGSLLFHNWQDSHHNIKPPEYTRGFHIDLNANWFTKNNISLNDFEGSLDLKNPLLKGAMNKIFLETKINDIHTQARIELLIIDIFNKIINSQLKNSLTKPKWLKSLEELILETEIDYSLTYLSEQLNIHPVHLSREFTNHFGSTLGQYVRQLKLNKAINLLLEKKYSMTEICYKCGFYDQSHFIKNFKSIYKINPSSFLKHL